MDNCALLVVPGLSSSSSSSSASTSRPKDQANSSGESETSSDPMTTRSAKHACGKPMQTNPDEQASGNRGSAHKEDEMNEEDPTQGIPDWLQPFTDNLEELSKVETQKRKHSIHTHLVATYAQEPKLRGCRAEDAMRDPFHEQKSSAT